MNKTNLTRWDSEVKKNTNRIYYWTFGWVLSIWLLGIGPQIIWNFNSSATVFAALLNLAIGIGMIKANVRFLKGQDEMQQRIFLEAAALTLGVTVVCTGSYQTWQDIKLISFEPQVWHLMCVMGLTFMVGTAVATRKYK